MSLDIFIGKGCRKVTATIAGKDLDCYIYMLHDEHMGKCLLVDGNEYFVTPNMPKLQYAIDFAVKGDELILKDSLSEVAKEFEGESMYVFEKRDGFNLLFYKYNGEVIPKTRMKPIASEKTRRVINIPEFPFENVKELVNDDYIPIFEVWGTKLDELGILHGSVNCEVVQKLESLPELNVELIALMVADYNRCEYKFVSPDIMMEIAKVYGLKTAPLHSVIELTAENVKGLMDFAENRNEKFGSVVIEGFVLHGLKCNFMPKYGMFKVKPYSIMAEDVITSKTIPKKRIQLEVSKVLLDSDVFEVAKNPQEYLDLVCDYLKEDYKLTKEILKKIRDVFVEMVAEELLRQNPELTPAEAGRQGIHKMFIGAIIRTKRKKSD